MSEWALVALLLPLSWFVSAHLVKWIGTFSASGYYPSLKRVIVNTKTNRAFRGILWRKEEEYLVLRNAELLKERGETTPIDGELVIDRINVDFLQVIV